MFFVSVFSFLVVVVVVVVVVDDDDGDDDDDDVFFSLAFKSPVYPFAFPEAFPAVKTSCISFMMELKHLSCSSATRAVRTALWEPFWTHIQKSSFLMNITSFRNGIFTEMTGLKILVCKNIYYFITYTRFPHGKPPLGIVQGNPLILRMVSTLTMSQEHGKEHLMAK